MLRLGMLLVGAGAAILGAVPLRSLAAAQGGPWRTLARVTHYDEVGYAGCGDAWTVAGTAACSWDIPCGATVVFWDGQSVVCNGRGGDLGRGRLDGQPSWVDVWAPG